MVDAVAAADVLDQPDRALDRRGRVVLEPEREREEEERLESVEPSSRVERTGRRRAGGRA
jgi:hypothetical protein